MNEIKVSRAKQFADKAQKIDSIYKLAASKLSELEQKKLGLIRSYNKKKDDKQLAAIRASINDGLENN